MNTGTFDYLGRKYTKYVAFNKAVLWKDRQLSLPIPVMDTIKWFFIEKIIFIDNGKQEKWEFPVDKVLERGEQKTVGQEVQWYFPIELANKKPVKPYIYK